MYEVIKMYGDFEPWWFLDGWEEDIVSRRTFSNYEEATEAFQVERDLLSGSFPHEKSKDETMVAFWTPDDQYWCEECDEYLQRYHSLLLMESQKYEGSASKTGGLPRIRPCKLKKEHKQITG